MKRFSMVMLALGLVAVFSSAVFAVEVKFSGEYYAAGLYLDKTTLIKDYFKITPPPSSTEGIMAASNPTTQGPSTAFYFQRLRVKTEFIVMPGLSLITRFDAMERAWGATRSTPGTTQAADSAGTRAENENIAFDWVYINYKSGIGIFDVGYMNDGSTGTIFGNSYAPSARIKYAHNFGPVKVALAYTKVKEGSRTAVNATNVTDADRDKYGILGEFKWKGGKTGLNVNYYRYVDTRPTLNYKRLYFLFTPYVIAKIGPVALQAEFNYLTGDQKYEAPAVTPDKKLDNISGWIDATADFGKFYAGGSIAYVSGDDPGTTDKIEGGIINGGRDWNPCLIMWNYERTNWAGALMGYDGSAQDTAMANGWFFQVRGGVRPIPEVDVMVSVAYANADKKPAGFLYNAYGYEVDVTAAYKITNNLTYMLGAGYLFTGNYYKGMLDANQLNNDYLVINKLTLTF